MQDVMHSTLDTDGTGSSLVHQLIERITNQIKGYAEKYKPYTCYEVSDFVSLAYEAAVEAIEDARKYNKLDILDSCFWTKYKQKCAEEMITVPNKKDILGDEAFSEENDLLKTTPCTFVSLSRSTYDDVPVFEIASHDTPLSDLLEKEESDSMDVAQNVKKALALMTDKEREVWHYLLGFCGEIPTMAEIAKRMGVSLVMIKKLKRNSLNLLQTVFTTHKELFTIEEAAETVSATADHILSLLRTGSFAHDVDYIERINGKRRTGNLLITGSGLKKIKELTVRVEA